MAPSQTMSPAIGARSDLVRVRQAWRSVSGCHGVARVTVIEPVEADGRRLVLKSLEGGLGDLDVTASATAEQIASSLLRQALRPLGDQLIPQRRRQQDAGGPYCWAQAGHRSFRVGLTGLRSTVSS
jgi:hypothetical protein